MNVQMSIERLSDNIRQLIFSEPNVRERCEQGESLEQILCCPKWAAAWLQCADAAQIEVLSRILLRYAALPFELEGILKTEVVQHSLSGAEIRIAVARLRRSGVLFAIRKAWGDQLIYLPTDTVAMWQPLLLPLEINALPETAVSEIIRSRKSFCLPLSLELLLAWHTIYRQPISVTSKGALHRPTLTQLTSRMRLNQKEFDFLALSYPQKEQIPAQVALALDIGLTCGILAEEGKGIRVSKPHLQRWLALTPTEADCRLHDLIMTRYGSMEPALHLLASTIHSLPIEVWFKEESIQAINVRAEMIDQWLGLMDAFGWVDRGMVKGQPVFRKNDRLAQKQPYSPSTTKTLIIQPDGEIFVPPETGLEQRWMLEEVSERVTIDNLFIYRLTNAASMGAFKAGYSFQEVVAFLEHNACTGLPDSCRRALQDWFAPLGKVNLADVVLLRTESPDIAALLWEDPQLSEHLLERVGDKDFIIGAAAAKLIESRLLQIGYPLFMQTQTVKDTSNEEIRALHQERENGWIYRQHVLSVYEPDRTLPSKEDLFPGAACIPAAWISQPRAYHTTTCKQIIQQAIQWQVSVQLGRGSEKKSFTPLKLEDEGLSWRVYGLWEQEVSMKSFQAADISEIMILLPSLEVLESI